MSLFPPVRLGGGLALLLAALAAPVSANPQGATLRWGQASVVGEGTPRVDVHQQSRSALITWGSFDVQRGETTRFHQPSSDAVAINRILDQKPSQIFGSLEANGHLYLINPNGILFGRDSVVNVHALAATTSLDAEDLAPLAGGFDPSARSAPGARIENHGRIQAGQGGFVYLIAPRLENGASGLITAPGGEVRLEAGASVYLTDRADGRGVAIRYTAPAGEVVNLGRLVADGGLVRVKGALLRQAGAVEANAVREQAGRVELYATELLRIEAGSRSEARGGEHGVSAGGTLYAYSETDAVVEAGARLDVSGGHEGGAGGDIEVSSRRNLDLAGSFRATAAAGYEGGYVFIDPERLRIASLLDLSGVQGGLRAEADEVITVAGEIRLQEASAVGAPDPLRPKLSLDSGGHIVFESGAKIVDDGAAGDPVWDVALLAGRLFGNGGLYLAGASIAADPVGGELPVLSVGRGNGEVALGDGEIAVRTAGDVVIGDGGGLRTRSGKVDVRAGVAGTGRGSVLFTASDPASDGVIESGSGDLVVVAEDSVDLSVHDAAHGNAAIRTRGVAVLAEDGTPTLGREDGGGILVVARTGRVDAGAGDRWVQGGSSLAPSDGPLLGASVGTPIPELPAYDVLPVVTEGILGIGTEAGGDVTVIAAGDVVTDSAPSPSHRGSTASGAGTLYDGARIGVFGEARDQVVVGPPDFPEGFQEFLVPAYVSQPVVPRADNPLARLTVLAGGNVTGDFMARNATAVIRAGYEGLAEALLGPGDAATPVSTAWIDAQLAAAPEAASLSALDRHALAVDFQNVRSEGGAIAGDPRLVRSALLASPALSDAQCLERGWFGTLEKPVTVDLVHASVDARGQHGAAVRAVENPSLVYPRAMAGEVGDQRVASYGPRDLARIEAETGDVVLIGNSDGAPGDSLVRLLPPNVEIRTRDFQREGEARGGDLVILDLFGLFPSPDGGLAFDVAGTVRGPGYAAFGESRPGFTGESPGAAGDQAFVLPAGTRVRNTETGLEYVLESPLSFARRLPAQIATGTASVRLLPGVADQGVDVPAGTRFQAVDGRIYQTLLAQRIPPLEQRPAVGEVVFVAAEIPRDLPITIGATLPNGRPREFVTPDGQVYRLTRNVSILPGRREVVAPVESVTLGESTRRGTLALRPGHEIPGIQIATNPRSTVVPEVFQIDVAYVEAGTVGSVLPGRILRMLDPIPGVVTVANEDALVGVDPAFAGIGTGPDGGTARAHNVLGIQGPAGQVGSGRVVVVQGSLPGPVLGDLGRPVNLGGIEIFGTAEFGNADTAQVVLRELQIVRDASGRIVRTRPDPDPYEIALVQEGEFYEKRSDGAPGFQQSDAEPGFDGRNIHNNFTDYARYYGECRSGNECAVLDPDAPFSTPIPGSPPPGTRIRRGTGPTHAGDVVPASLRVGGNTETVPFVDPVTGAVEQVRLAVDRVRIELAEAAELLAERSLRDLTLVTQHANASDTTRVAIRDGDAFFGSFARTLVDCQLCAEGTSGPDAPGAIVTRLPGDGTSGVQVAGPGHGEILVGVVRHAEADRNGDGVVSFDEFPGPFEVFSGLDQRFVAVASLADGRLTPQEAPFIPTASSSPRRLLLSEQSGGSGTIGIESVGNLRGNLTLPARGVALEVVSWGGLRLGGFGAISSLQGGSLYVSSVGGAVIGGDPPPGVGTPPKRGIVSVVVVDLGRQDYAAAPSGGGPILVDSHLDFDIRRTALATLSGSSISIESRAGSARLGTGTPFEIIDIRFNSVSPVVVYSGSGVFAAPPGTVQIVAKEDIDIGAGISAAGVTIDAGGNVVSTGSGGIVSTGNVNISSGGSITASVSAGGSVSVGSGTVTSGSSFAASGIVTGAGSVAANTGSGRSSAETSNVSREASDQAGALAGGGAAAASEGRKGVIINVSSRPDDEDEG